MVDRLNFIVRTTLRLARLLGCEVEVIKVRNKEGSQSWRRYSEAELRRRARAERKVGISPLK